MVNVYGEVDRDKLENSTVIFLKKADKCRKLKLRQKEKSNNGCKSTSRAIDKKQILDR